MNSDSKKPKKQESPSISKTQVDTQGHLITIADNKFIDSPQLFYIDGVRDLRFMCGDLNFVYLTTPQG